MKDDWEIKKLKDVILQIKDGGTPSRTKPEYFGGDVNWCVVKDILPEIYSTRENLTELGLSKCSAKVWGLNSVIISLGATIGQVGIAKVPVATKQGISGIVVNEKLLYPEFLVYYLNFKKEFIQSIATGATIKEVRPSKLAEKLDFPLPPLTEQQRIIAILDEAFAAIDKAKANAEKNLKNAKELFESYLQGVFDNKGEGWVEKTLGEVCSLITDGKHGDCENEAGSGYYFLSAKDVRNGTLLFENARQITKCGFEETHKRTNLKPGDICMVNTGATIGRISFAPDDPRTYHSTFQKSVAVIKTIPDLMNNYYCCYLLQSDVKKLVKVSSGTAVPNLLLGDLKRHKINMPNSLKAQLIIVQKLDALSLETKRLESIYQQKLTDLEELKKSILQKAFNGELNTADICV